MQIGIPWRDSGDPHRARNAKFVIQFYEIMGYEIVLGDSQHNPFNRSAAKNACVKQIDSDVVPIVDMDIVMERPSDLWRGVNLARKYNKLVMPIYELYWLDPENTARFLAGETINKSNLTPELWLSGGVHIIPKQLHDIMGGYDEKYVGWGYEDIDYYVRHNKMFGEYLRMKAVAYHLWHPVASLDPNNQKIFNKRKYSKRMSTGMVMEWEE